MILRSRNIRSKSAREGEEIGSFSKRTLSLVIITINLLFMFPLKVTANLFESSSPIEEVDANANMNTNDRTGITNPQLNEQSVQTASMTHISTIAECENIVIDSIPVIPYFTPDVSNGIRYKNEQYVYFTDSNIWQCTHRKKANDGVLPGSETFESGIKNGWTLVRSCVTEAPSDFPSLIPSFSPTFHPTSSPTISPSVTPSEIPSSLPSLSPTYTCQEDEYVGGTNYKEGDRIIYNEIIWECLNKKACDKAAKIPGSKGARKIWRPIGRCITDAPSLTPSFSNPPTNYPPTLSPTVSPTGSPTIHPTNLPTASPTTASPTTSPTSFVTASPTSSLCEEYADICRLHVSTYTDHDNTRMQWWAYEPIGEYSCPDEGCPLYIWIDGTDQDPYEARNDQLYLMEMLKRGFVAASVEYDAGVFDYGAGCYGKWWFDSRGFTHKSREIFDGDVSDSVVSQLCDKPSTKLANCDLGIATHGFSQGAHIASLAGNYEPRVSATLLFGNGNDNTIPIAGDFTCLASNKLSLPKERRRSIVGESDQYFGGSYGGVLKQQIATSGYDCRRYRYSYRYGDHWNCFNKLPSGCSYGRGESFCEEYELYYTLACSACNVVPAEGPCPSKPGLITNACPKEVLDPYIGNGAYIEGTAGYYIISGEEYCRFLGCDPEDGVPHTYFQYFHPNSDFLNPDVVWGLPQNLDWLARIARKTKTGLLLGY